MGFLTGRLGIWGLVARGWGTFVLERFVPPSVALRAMEDRRMHGGPRMGDFGSGEVEQKVTKGLMFWGLGLLWESSFSPCVLQSLDAFWF